MNRVIVLIPADLTEIRRIGRISYQHKRITFSYKGREITRPLIEFSFDLDRVEFRRKAVGYEYMAAYRLVDPHRSGVCCG